MTQRGLFSPLIDVTPRTRTLGAAPNVPDTFWMATPAAAPSSMRLTSVTPFIFMSSTLSLVAEPVKVVLLMVWKPVTTTFSICAASSFNVNLKAVRCPMTCSAGSMPRNCTSRIDLGVTSAENENFPAASV